MDSSKPFWLIKCERGYEDAQQRFVLGDHEGAFDGFKSVYMRPRHPQRQQRSNAVWRLTWLHDPP